MGNTLLPVIVASAAKAGREDRKLDIQERRGRVAEELGRARLGLGERALNLDVDKFLAEQDRIDTERLTSRKRAASGQLKELLTAFDDGFTTAFLKQAEAGGFEVALAQLMSSDSIKRTLQRNQQIADELTEIIGLPRISLSDRLTGRASLVLSPELSGQVKGRTAVGQLTGAGLEPTEGRREAVLGASPAADTVSQIARMQTERDRAAAEGRTADARELQGRIEELATSTPQGAQSKVGKLVADRDADRITPELFSSAIEKEFRNDPSIGADFLFPILDKVRQQGAQSLTPGENDALTILQRISPENQFLAKTFRDAGLIPGGSPGISSPRAPLTPRPALTAEQETLLNQAREAISQGRDPEAVKQMLRERGVDPGLL